MAQLGHGRPISLRCTESTAFQDLLCFPSDPRPGTVWCARWPRAIPRRPTRSVPDFGNATSPGGAAISRPGGRAHHVGLIEPADRLAVRVPSAVAVSATPISRAHITRRARSSFGKQCNARARSGEQCKNRAVRPHGVCYAHGAKAIEVSKEIAAHPYDPIEAAARKA